MMSFEDSILLKPAGDNLWQGDVDPAYRGFGSQFGGWTGAALLKAAMMEAGANGLPLSLSVLFIDAVGEGSFEVATRLLRSGARLQFWRSELSQRARICAHAQATFGVRRATTRFTDAQKPDMSDPEAHGLPEWSPPSGFGARYRMRWITPPPRSVHADPAMPASSLVWIRDCERRPLDILQLAAMADLAPPRVIWKREAISGSSTVSMTTHFHATPEEIADVGGDWILSEVRCRRCEGGYFDHELRLWSRAGALLATSEQVAAFRD